MNAVAALPQDCFQEETASEDIPGMLLLKIETADFSTTCVPIFAICINTFQMIMSSMHVLSSFVTPASKFINREARLVLLASNPRACMIRALSNIGSDSQKLKAFSGSRMDRLQYEVVFTSSQVQYVGCSSAFQNAE